MAPTDTYSGVVINQNASATQYAWRTNGANWIYQTFTLPSDYQRGTNSAELRIPDLSGLQVFVTIDTGYAQSAALDYVLHYYGGANVGWMQLSSGTVIGAHTDGQVWMDIPFVPSVPVSTQTLTAQFLLGIKARTAVNAALNQPVETAPSPNTYIINGQSYTATLIAGVPYPITVGGLPAYLLLNDTQVTYSIQQGISTIGYVTPTPLIRAGSIQGQAYQADALTLIPLLGALTTSSINFRVLGLVADNGTNFMNNEYRSCVVSASVGNTSTTAGLAPVTLGGPSTYWMSPPQPSRFAVQSLYFDMRPVSTTPAFGTINNIGNPSFEYDRAGFAPQWWMPFSSGETVIDQTVHDNAPWTFSGFQALHMKYTFSGATQQQGIISPFQAVAATTSGQSTPVAVSVAYDLITASQASLLFTLLFYDNNQTLLPSPFGTASATVSVTGTGTLSGTFLMPANTVYIKYMISALSAGAGSFEAYVDAAQATLTPTVQPYFDGDQPDTQWIAQRGNSPSAQLVTPTVGTDAIVIDGVMVDPLTPNMAFNVYYSQDDAYTNDSMTESDWEQKLWVRVPEVYVCIQRQSYAFPQPIQAKYVKVEFTNLQAQSYKPGKFQKPVSYKKFPTWVANYFLTQLEQPSFVASRVNVEYDALSFAYDYFLDDLDQSPTSPSAPPQDLISQLTSYFNSSTTGVDSATLAQINLVMKPFQASLGSHIDIGTSLGSYVSGLVGSTTPPVTISEGGTLTPLDYSTVSTLQREPVVLEQNMPVMFFFITCRHTYKELTAPFAHNRAYFAGVNEVAFLRNDYTVATDSSLYIESGGDPANMQFSDWVLDTDGNWFTY